MDGFETVSEDFLQTGAVCNVEPYLNCYSPYSEVYRVESLPQSDRYYIDTYYGLIYENWIQQYGAPYGVTAKFPSSFLNADATEFLRTPFATIPYIKARDRKDLDKIVNCVATHYPKLQLLFRGQTKLHELGRSDDTLTRLYGESVREPSLLSSSERHGINIDEIAPTWSGFLRYSLDLWAAVKKDKKLHRYYNELGNDYTYRFLALAIAQHYGLPSCGLDVTYELDVALFFALRTLERTNLNYIYIDAPVSKAEQPVLYLFGVENISKYIHYNSSILRMEGNNRPDAQSACFLADGWGMARNKAACSLIATIELNPSGDYSPISDTKMLFPNEEFDALGKCIDSARINLRDDLPQLGAFLDYFYWVETRGS